MVDHAVPFHLNISPEFPTANPNVELNNSTSFTSLPVGEHGGWDIISRRGAVRGELEVGRRGVAEAATGPLYACLRCNSSIRAGRETACQRGLRGGGDELVNQIAAFRNVVQLRRL